MVSNHQKETMAPFSEVMRALHKASQIRDEFMKMVDENADRLDNVIDYDRDYLFTYFGFRTFETSYGLRIKQKDPITGVDKPVVYERPQHMWMRVSLALHLDDIDAAIETYDWMSCQYFTHATPTLFNSGKRQQQLASCFLLAMKEDSIEGIYSTLSNVAKISKNSGGIGIHISNVRAEGSPIVSAGCESAGIIPMLKPFEATANYVDQGRKRKGAIAIYLEPWHADIEDFLQIKSQTGDENRRMRDLHLALWMCDLFMRRVEADAEWSLMCPFYSRDLQDLYGEAFEHRYREYEELGAPYVRRTVRARELWTRIVDSQITTGEPYMVYKDSVNKKTNHQNLGTIRSSNLCVAPYTRIFTKNGYTPISDLKDQDVDIWNGFEWSNVTVRQTGENKKLLRVKLSNGSIIDCTPEHKFHLNTKYYPKDISHRKAYKNENYTKVVSAKNLQEGDKLIKHEIPIIKDQQCAPLKYAYTHGFYCGDGCDPTNASVDQCVFAGKDDGYCERHKHFRGLKMEIHDEFVDDQKRCKAQTFQRAHIRLYGEKKDLSSFIEGYNRYEDGDRTKIDLYPDIAEKFSVPFSASLENKLSWLEGLFDADGTVARNGTNESLQLSSIHPKFLSSVMLLLQTMGIFSKVTMSRDTRETLLPDGKGGKKLYTSKACYRLLITSVNTLNLRNLGFKPKRLVFQYENHIPDRDASRFVEVLSVTELDGEFDTFCFTEPKMHLGTFEGVVTGQCAEILEYSDADHTAVCNLASIALKRFVVTKEDGTKSYDFETLKYVVKMITRNLDRVIDINDYPTIEGKRSNLRERPMGIGVQGLADAYIAMRFPYDSEQAAKLNRDIFETIYFGAMEASCELAKEHGPYPSYNMNGGSPISHGKFQFDMWADDGFDVKLSGMWDWDALRADIIEHGVRNSLLVALMPTASTSQLLGNCESFEAFTNNIYVRTTLAGSFKVMNQQMVLDLIDAGLWTNEIKSKVIYLGGSIQGIEEIPKEIRELYKTSFDLSQKVIIDQSADRAFFVDQSQSLNIHMAEPTMASVSSMHMYANKKGLKTGMYYLRSRPAKRAAQVTVDPAMERQFERQLSTPAVEDEVEAEPQVPDGWVCNKDEGCTMCSG